MMEIHLKLKDGAPVLLRPLLPLDRERIQTGVMRMSFESKYRRFFSAVRKLSDDQLRYITEADQKNHVAWGAADATDPSLPGIGVARFVRLPENPPTAEFALAVADSFQHKGLGTALMSVLYLRALAEKIETLRAVVLTENRHVIDWLLRLGAMAKSCAAGVVEMDLPVVDKFVPHNRTGTAFADMMATLSPYLGQNPQQI